MMASYSLVSLWDMLKIKAEAFCRCTYTLGMVKTSISLGGAFVPSFLNEKVSQSGKDHPCKVMAISDLTVILDDLSSLDARMTRISVERLIDKLKNFEELDFKSFEGMIEQCYNRLYDELSLLHIFGLDAKHSEYFEGVNFGAEVSDKFPGDLAYEIDEANKCLAFDRSTAAVFHLMRAMEIGLVAVRRCLGIPESQKSADRNWGAIIKLINSEVIQKAFCNKPDDKPFFQEVHASLDAVKTAWRNPTMHVEKKYTMDEAEQIHGAVKGFFQKIASRMDENGLPTA